MRSLSAIDGLLLLVMFIWGGNFSVVKAALGEVSPRAFNSLRLLLATGLFLAVLRLSRRFGRHHVLERLRLSDTLAHSPGLTTREWLGVAALGTVGHFVYQLCFIEGLERTTAANSALIVGSNPVIVALLAALLGVERIGRLHWLGAGLSMIGIYLVVGRSSSISGASLPGDLLVLGAVGCWAIYTLASRPLLARHSPLVVTAYSMAFGTGGFVAVSWRELRDPSWMTMSGNAWAALVFSAVFALFVAYLVWYAAVQRLGSAGTAIYANLVPVAGVAIAVLWLGEALDVVTVFGAAAIVGGVALTKAGRRESIDPPAEE